MTLALFFNVDLIVIIFRSIANGKFLMNSIVCRRIHLHIFKLYTKKKIAPVRGFAARMQWQKLLLFICSGRRRHRWPMLVSLLPRFTAFVPSRAHRALGVRFEPCLSRVQQQQ